METLISAYTIEMRIIEQNGAGEGGREADKMKGECRDLFGVFPAN